MRTIIVSLIAVAMLLSARESHALRQVRVYEATVSSQTDAAVQAQGALRQVLVRATGARDAANDPVFAGILAQASQYVLGTRPAGTGGALTVMFDAAALERDIVAAGRTVWGSERPLLIIILTGGPASGLFESRRQVEGVLDGAANRRGQPIRVARPEAAGLPVTGDIPADVALAAAQRLGGDAVLVGYGDAIPSGGVWRWEMTAAGMSQSWTGTLDEAVNASTDVFARNAVAFAALPDATVLVEVEGVPTLREYARVADLIGGAAGVRSVQLAEAAGARATFSVVTRGGVDALPAALGARFERIDP